MRSRLLTALTVVSLSLAMTACQDEQRPQTVPASSTPLAPTSPAVAPSAPTASPEPSPAKPTLVGPRTNCGEVKAANGDLVAVGVLRGRTTCATVLHVFRIYYRPSTPKQGSAGVATVNGWSCASNTAAETTTTGRASSCRKDSTTITADVIP